MEKRSAKRSAKMTSIAPFLLQDSAPGELQDAAVELMQLDAALNAHIPESLRESLKFMLRVVNSFYSNRIEGNPTQPAEILKAQLNKEKDLKDDLFEIKHHIEVQKYLNQKSLDRNEICTVDFLKELHRSFYEGMPKKFLEIDNEETGEKINIQPGKFRTRDFHVGKHIAPEYQELTRLLNWFSNAYSPDRVFGTNRIFAAAASHHRLMWIHPFMDGNGRVGRLFTDNYMKHCANLGGYGLWSISRGFGRDVDSYYQALAAADMERQGSSDGRGMLSDRGLLKFTTYFIETALDQVKFFYELLDPKRLVERVDIYFEMRNRQAITGLDGSHLPKMRPEVKTIYKELLTTRTGELERTEIQGMFNLGERTIRTILSQMVDERLVSAPPRKPVSLSLSPNSVEILFPRLW
ncbi:Fic family protein [Endozoicomonas sp. ALC066]|uniref:Fic family protein n=2 Tax=unclassified Endozoicomonas TaxID=2644528 RepID=UPI003BB6EDE8